MLFFSDDSFVQSIKQYQPLDRSAVIKKGNTELFLYLGFGRNAL